MPEYISAREEVNLGGQQHTGENGVRQAILMTGKKQPGWVFPFRVFKVLNAFYRAVDSMKQGDTPPSPRAHYAVGEVTRTVGKCEPGWRFTWHSSEGDTEPL